MLAPYTGKRKAIIVGAGPGGLATAVGLRRCGIDVVVCEKAAELKPVGSGLTIWPNASRALDAIGMLPAFAATCLPFSRIAMKNWRDGEIFSDPLAAVDGAERYISFGLSRREMIDLLARPVADAILTDACVVGVQQAEDGVVVKLTNGRELDGDLLLAADGLHSVVRKHVIPNDSALSYAGYTVWRGIAHVQLGHTVGTTWMGPGVQFGLFPLANGRAYWFASCKAPEGLAPEATDLRRHIISALASPPDPIPEIVAATDDGSIIQTNIYDRPPLQQWVFGRVALLGDAAHPAQPTLGQGACQAMEDAAVLAACMSACGNVVEALRLYERRRIRRANGFVDEARHIGKAGLWQSAAACWLRDKMMGAMPAGMRRKQLAKMFAFEAVPQSISVDQS